ncbi:MAG: AEC family transporter, partial [Firmicutes bacterium]|nr:AEC family transporter [Bacillota bacterium]
TVLLRMIVFPVLLVGLAYLSGADDRILIFALFVHALPLGLNPVIYPPQYGKDARPGASMALISTALSLLTLPLFYALLLKLLGALPTV